MFIKTLQDCGEFFDGDNTILRELLHPDNADLNFRYSLAHARQYIHNSGNSDLKFLCIVDSAWPRENEEVL